jgi:hypothetical protein
VVLPKNCVPATHHLPPGSGRCTAWHAAQVTEISCALSSALSKSTLRAKGKIDGATLTGATLNDAHLDNVHLLGANISDASLVGADISGATFADLSGSQSTIGWNNAVWAGAYYYTDNKPAWASGMDDAWRTSKGIIAKAPPLGEEPPTVPEPATFLLALFGLALLPHRCRKEGRRQVWVL